MRTFILAIALGIAACSAISPEDTVVPEMDHSLVQQHAQMLARARQRLAELHAEGHDDTACRTMADDSIKSITDQVAADNTAMQDIETGANCEQKADNLSGLTEAQSKLTQANEAKQEADGKLQEAEQAEIRPPLVFGSLDAEQETCPDLYSSDEYKEAKTTYDTAKAAADAATEAQQLAQQSADTAATVHEQATHECLCDAQKVHAQLVDEYATTNADNQQVWEDSHAILAVLDGGQTTASDGDEDIAELAQTTAPECPTVTIPDLTDEAKSAHCEGGAANTEEEAANTEEEAANTEEEAANTEEEAANTEEEAANTEGLGPLAIVASPQDNRWRALAYGNSLFVAIAEKKSTDKLVMYSSDAQTWTTAEATEDTDNNWTDLTFGNGLFVAVAAGGHNRVMYSSNAQTWTAVAAAEEANSWKSVTYGNGLFVAVCGHIKDGNNHPVMYSSDAQTWTGVALAEEAGQWPDITAVTYGNGLFVAVTGNGKNQAIYSSDAQTWTTVALAESGNHWSALTYGNGLFVAVAGHGNNKVMYSSDAQTWTTVASADEAAVWKDVVYCRNLFVAVAHEAPSYMGGTPTDKLVMYSSDAQTWTPVVPPEKNSWWAATCANNNQFAAVAIKGTVMYTAA